MTEYRGKNVIIYARVSTVRQAHDEVSLRDQIGQAEKWIADRGAIHVKTFTEAGASATSDVRAEFRSMVEATLRGDLEVDVILAHSLSRFFRNAHDYFNYRVKLRSRGVELVSMTQDFGSDSSADLALGMVALFDEYQSAENGKHVRRTMNENARAGYWNGQRPPLGFKAVPVIQEKGKTRKRLVQDDETSWLVRFIFKTYVLGTPNGKIGITKLAQLLNERGETLKGAKFHVSNVQAILRNTAYIGVVFFNKRDTKNKCTRPESEWIPIQVPALISEELFYKAQAQLTERNPRMGASATKTNANLLTGKIVCGTGDDGCGGGLTTATGKSGQYRYYACHTAIKAGKSQCTGQRVRMERLDAAVTESIISHVLQPDRLRTLLSGWISQNESSQFARRRELGVVKSRITRLDTEKTNVIQLVRNGIILPDDPQIARELGQISAQKEAACAELNLIEKQLQATAHINDENLGKVAELIASTLRDSKHPLRKAYVDLLIDQVAVGDKEIRITGAKDRLARAASGTPPHMVPKAERKWRALQESNLRPQD